jgi:hypothetical protein
MSCTEPRRTAGRQPRSARFSGVVHKVLWIRGLGPLDLEARAVGALPAMHHDRSLWRGKEFCARNLLNLRLFLCCIDSVAKTSPGVGREISAQDSMTCRHSVSAARASHTDAIEDACALKRRKGATIGVTRDRKQGRDDGRDRRRPPRQRPLIRFASLEVRCGQHLNSCTCRHDIMRRPGCRSSTTSSRRCTPICDDSQHITKWR